jgi:hypothetical protein
MRARCAFCFARLPQISISHQRRCLFLVVSKNSQPQWSPPHCLMRETSLCASSVRAERAIGPRIASTKPSAGRHDQTKLPRNGVSRARATQADTIDDLAQLVRPRQEIPTE